MPDQSTGVCAARTNALTRDIQELVSEIETGSDGRLFPTLDDKRLLAAQGMQLLIWLDGSLREARADWNQDPFRRLMRLRPRVVARLRRRWEILNPQPSISLGTLRRRYHANLAGYLNTHKG